MKRVKKGLAIAVSLLIIGSFFAVAGSAQGKDVKQIDVLFTHDTHSHVLPVKEFKEGKIGESGGYARIKTVLDEKRSEDKNTITVDAGDFTVGSLFQTLCTTECAELRLLGDMDYDVVTAGNHEFDFGDMGFANMLNAAKDSTDRLPEFVMSNLGLRTDENGEYNELGKSVESAIKHYGIKNYTVISKDNVKIAVFGLMGDNAAKGIQTQTTQVRFDDISESAKKTVEQIKQNEDVDMIMCLSHTGTNNDPNKSEDEKLAKEVPDIDLIISGHTHTVLEQPKVVGNTYIVSAGCYAENLGEINMIQDSSTKKWRTSDYNLTPIDSSIAHDKEIQSRIEKFKPIIQEKYLDGFGYTFDQVLAKLPYSFTNINDIWDLDKGVKEEPLGNLISDSYRYALKNATGEDVDIAVSPQGTMRASLVEGNITVSDVFNTNSLGMGSDGVQTYPIVNIYVRGSDLKTVCEIDASLSSIMIQANLYMSGISYTYNLYRMPLDKVTDVKIEKPDGTRVEVEKDKLYSCAVGLYAAQMLSRVKDISYGLVNIPLFDAQGNEIKDKTFKDQIVYEDSKELKEWQATAEYISSFEKVDGVSTFPDYYNVTHDRKIAKNTNNLLAIVSNPGITTIAVLAALVLVPLIIILIIVLIIKIAKRGQKDKKYKKQV